MLTSDEIESMDRRLADGRERLLRRVRVRARSGRLTVMGAVLLIAGSAAAATLGAEGAHSQDLATSVTCFDQPSLDAPHRLVTVSLQGKSAGDVDAAVRRACDDPEATRPAGEQSQSGQVLAAVCRLGDGAIGVFRQAAPEGPDRQDCADLGLVEA